MMIFPLPGFYEPVSSIMHLGAACVFAVLGVRLVLGNRGCAVRVVLLSVLAIASVLMLSMSGVYHMLSSDSAGGQVLYRLDMASIFVMIAATFTAVHGMYFRGVARWLGLVLMWMAAIVGLTLTVVFVEHIPWGVSTMMYLLLGWITSVSLIVAWREHGWKYVRLLIYGGVAYSVGAVLLELKWPTIVPGVIGPHEMWHIAVIIGLSLHWRFVAKQAREHEEGERYHTATAIAA